VEEPKISFRLPEDLYEKAKEKANREDITLSQVLRRCLRDWVEEDTPEEPEQEA
jgi:predicted HicB family RNase H-like nuclease